MGWMVVGHDSWSVETRVRHMSARVAPTTARAPGRPRRWRRWRRWRAMARAGATRGGGGDDGWQMSWAGDGFHEEFGAGRYETTLSERTATWGRERVGDDAVIALTSSETGRLIDCDGSEIERVARRLTEGGAGTATARAYAGHQFGTFAGALGDGRVVSLGWVKSSDGTTREVQVKGGGKTTRTRDGGDGRCTLRSTIREFLCAEILAALDVPTTRLMCVISTNEGVVRRTKANAARLEYGGMSVRVCEAPLVRFGTFELPASRRDFDCVRALADHVIASDLFVGEIDDVDRYGALLCAAARRNAITVARWMSIGFVHGVMNTDNTTVCGTTIDLGRFGFMEAYDEEFCSNPDDETKMYAFGRQRSVARWNVERLCDAFERVVPASAHRSALRAFDDAFENETKRLNERKFGVRDDDGVVSSAFHRVLRVGGFDFTRAHRALGEIASTLVESSSSSSERVVRNVFARLFDVDAEQLDRSVDDFARAYASALSSDARDARRRRSTQDATNPVFILRERDVSEAIDAAIEDDWTLARTLAHRCATPFRDEILS